MSLINIISQITGGFDDTNFTQSNSNPLFIFTGESNSGGYALNTSASAPELAARSSVQILNNTSLLFENLDIGTNNLLDHNGLDPSLTHGWELELSNLVEANTFSVSQVHLVKTGQGASRISEWADPSTYWTKFKDRVDAALVIDPTFVPVIFYSQGINDAINGTNITTWKNNTIAHFAKIRTRYGANIPIIWPKLMSAYATYNTAIDEVVAVTSFCWSVETTDLSLRDANHWDYAGMKTMTQRMITKLLENYTL